MVTLDALHIPPTPSHVSLASSAFVSWEKSAHRLLKTFRYSFGRRSRANRARIISQKQRRLDNVQDLLAELEAAAVSPVNAAPSCVTAPGNAPSRSAARGCSVSIDADPGLPSGSSDTGDCLPPGTSFLTPQDRSFTTDSCGAMGGSR